MGEIQKTNLENIKNGVMGEGALRIFRDNMPAATDEHAEKAAKRFAKMVYTAICQSPTLQECSAASIIKSASISASLDLDIDPRGLAYLVPYKNKGIMQAQFQLGYMGLIELAYRSGKVKAISAHCVYESEKGQVTISRINGQYEIEHPFSYEPTTGKIVAVYATAEIDSLGPQTCVLRADEVERLRAVSKAPNSPAWKNHLEAMYKKTAIRQLAKFLPKSILPDFSKGAAIDERETFVEAKQTTHARIEAETGSEVITESVFEEPDVETPEWMVEKDEV